MAPENHLLLRAHGVIGTQQTFNLLSLEHNQVGSFWAVSVVASTRVSKTLDRGSSPLQLVWKFGRVVIALDC